MRLRSTARDTDDAGAVLLALAPYLLMVAGRRSTGQKTGSARVASAFGRLALIPRPRGGVWRADQRMV